MSYYYTTEPGNAVPGKSCANPKTHVPGSSVKERGYHLTITDDDLTNRPATKYTRAYPKPHGGPKTDWVLSTKYTDSETGLLYYGYRFYSANLSRWMNRDPIGPKGGRNLYVFVRNRPLGLIDRYGFCPSTEYGLCDETVDNMLGSYESTGCKASKRIWMAYDPHKTRSTQCTSSCLHVRRPNGSLWKICDVTIYVAELLQTYATCNYEITVKCDCPLRESTYAGMFSFWWPDEKVWPASTTVTIGIPEEADPFSYFPQCSGVVIID